MGDARWTARQVTRPRRHARRGLTLLEVIISIALMLLIMGAAATFFWQVGQTRKAATERAERTAIAQRFLNYIERELRGCIGFEKVGFPIEQPIIQDEQLLENQEQAVTTGPPPEQVPLLQGDRRSITFLTTALPAEHQYAFFRESENQPPAQADLVQVDYRLWISPEETDENGQPVVGGITRTEKKTLNQFLVDLEDPVAVRTDLWSHELGYLEFRYYDGVEWTTSWNITRGNSLPHAIMITVGFRGITGDELDDQDLEQYPIADYPFGDDQNHPDRYSVVVRVPAADEFFGARYQRVGETMAEQFGVEGVQ